MEYVTSNKGDTKLLYEKFVYCVIFPMGVRWTVTLSSVIPDNKLMGMLLLDITMIIPYC